MQTLSDAILAACVPYSLPGPWSLIPSHSCFVRFPVERADSLLAELCERFGGEALIEEGVAIADGDAIRWLPALLTSNEPLWIEKVPGPRIEIIVRGFVLSGRQWLFQLLCAQHSQGYQTVRAPDLVVTESTIDCAILRSLGIDAIPSAALMGLEPKHFKRICRMFGIWLPGQANLQPDLFSNLGFANWSISALDRSDAPKVLSVWNAFRDFSTKLSTHLHEFYLWKPSDAHIAKIKTWLEYFTVDEVCKLVETSLDNDSQLLHVTAGPAVSEVDRYLDVLRNARQVRHRSTNAYPLSSEAEEILDARVRQRTEPIVRKAFEATDPIQRERLLTLADATHLSLLAQREVLEQIALRAGKDDLQGVRSIAVDPMMNFCRIEATRLSIQKEVDKCSKEARTKKTTVPAERAPFRPWASCATKSPH